MNLNRINEVIKKIESYFTTKGIAAILSVLGLFSGASTLATAEASKPPLGWIAIGVIFIFGIFAMCILLGFQALIKNPSGVRLGWKSFFYISIYNFGSGISALAIALWTDRFSPAALLFIAFPAGIAAGLALTKPLLIEPDFKQKSEK